MWILSLLKPDSQAPTHANEQAEDLLPASVPYSRDSVCLSPIELMRFSRAYPSFRIANGQSLFREGAWGNSMYLLIDGRAEVSAHEHLVEVLLPGTLIGEASLLTPGPRPVTVTARTSCEFIEITEQAFYAIIRDTPEFAAFVMRVLAKRLQSAALYPDALPADTFPSAITRTGI